MEAPSKAAAALSERNIPALARNFIIAAMLSASLVKLAEALFNSFWSATDSNDIHNPLHVLTHMKGGFTFLFFFLYVVLLLGRDFALVYSPEIGTSDEHSKAAARQRTPMFLATEFLLTVCLLTFHYILAQGVADSVKGGHLGADAWPLAGFSALAFVLILRAALCSLHARWASQFNLGSLEQLLRTWNVLTYLELLTSITALALFALSYSLILPLTFLMVLSAADFFSAFTFWRAIGNSQ